jgi:hypothetical protein
MASGNQSTAVIQGASPGRLLRGFLISYLLTAASLGVVGCLWGRVGFDLLIVGMGWPHVIFGFLFNLGKAAEGDRGYRVALASLLLVTLAIGFVNSLRPLTTIIYLYFTFHAFRDEIFIYHQRRTGYRYFEQVFDRNGLGILLGAAAVALIGQLPVHGPNGKLQLYLGLCALAGLLGGVAWLFWPKQWVRGRLGLRYAFLALLLFAGAAAVIKGLRMHGLSSPSFFAFLVVFHYFSWYVFSLERASARPAPIARQAVGLKAFLQFLRTVPGFLKAVVVMNVFFMGCAYAYYILHLSPALKVPFDFKFFTYLLVFHVTTSFVPKISREATQFKLLNTEAA